MKQAPRSLGQDEQQRLDKRNNLFVNNYCRHFLFHYLRAHFVRSNRENLARIPVGCTKHAVVSVRAIYSIKVPVPVVWFVRLLILDLSSETSHALAFIEWSDSTYLDESSVRPSRENLPLFEPFHYARALVRGGNIA